MLKCHLMVPGLQTETPDCFPNPLDLSLPSSWERRLNSHQPSLRENTRHSCCFATQKSSSPCHRFAFRSKLTLPYNQYSGTQVLWTCNTFDFWSPVFPVRGDEVLPTDWVDAEHKGKECQTDRRAACVMSWLRTKNWDYEPQYSVLILFI